MKHQDIYFTCDRCGGRYHRAPDPMYHNCNRAFGRRTAYVAIPLVEGEYVLDQKPHRSADLCESCYHEFYAWWTSAVKQDGDA